MIKQLCLSLQLNLISFIFANEKAKNVALCKPEASCKLLIVQEIIILFKLFELWTTYYIYFYITLNINTDT